MGIAERTPLLRTRGCVMRTHEHEQFWMLYEQRARGPIERACRHCSRVKTDSSMDIDDMVAWIDTRIWTMLEKEAYPTFHDDPTPEQAIERILKHASTLARWSYLALCRSHFRRLENRSSFLQGMSRAERLSMASAVDSKIEKREELDQAINALRKSLSDNDKQRLSASISEKDERSRVALVLGATRREDDAMIRKINAETINANTVQQMRSRARKRAAEILQAVRKAPVLLLVTMLLTAISTTSARAGEQSGGRKGMCPDTPICEIHSPMIAQELVFRGEQTGGRRP